MLCIVVFQRKRRNNIKRTSYVCEIVKMCGGACV